MVRTNGIPSLYESNMYGLQVCRNGCYFGPRDGERIPYLVLQWEAAIQDIEGSFLSGSTRAVVEIFWLKLSSNLIFSQFLWRPRPPSLLSAEKEEEIAKNLKKYSKKYEAEDQDVSMQLNEQDRKKRKMLQDQWNEWVAKWKQWHEEERQLRIQLRDGVVSDEEEEYEAKEVEVEEVLDVREEIVAFDLDQE